MSETVSCNLCTRKKAYILFTKNDLSIVKCTNCGLVYTSPRLTKREVSKLYTTFNTKVSPKEVYSFERDSKKRIAGIIKLKKSGKILEVGCSFGYFLNAAQKMGFDVYGIELSKKAASIGRKRYRLKNVYSMELEKFNPNIKFDVITMYHTLEHLPDPKKSILHIRKLLKNDGLLVIEVPDVGSFKAKLLKEKWVAYDFNLHYYYFSYKTLRKILEVCGFKIIKKEIIAGAMIEGSVTKNVKKIPPGVKKILSVPYSYMTFALGKASIGDAIRIYAVKK